MRTALRTAAIAAGRVALSAIALAALSGCRTHLVDTTIMNEGAGVVRNVQVEYPSASFGVSQIDPGQQFHYRFRIQGEGTAKLTFTDPQGNTHTNSGFELHEGQQGAMTISLFQNGDNVWAAGLVPEQK